MKNKTIVVLLLVVVILLCNFQYFVLASTEIDKAHLKVYQESELHLQYKKGDIWSYISCLVVGYEKNGVVYPAYCLDRELPGPEAVEGGFVASICENLADVRLWRAITAGYPYKSPSEMGVETVWDAYTATKQAIYRILYDRDVLTYYRGTDERGKKIVLAIDRLVNEGRNGTRTPQSANVVINKVNNLIQKGDFFVQEFSISCNVNTDIYKITDITNLPEGSFVSDLNGNKKAEFSANEHFLINIPKTQMNKDLNYEIKISAKCETYPIFYGVAPSADLQNHAITYSKYGDFTGKATITHKTNTGAIEILKLDEETKKPLEGVSFTLYSEDNKELETVVTNSEGKAFFNNLYQGNYIVKETKTENGYILNTEALKAEVVFNKKTVFTITNKLKTGKIRIIKVDESDENIKLEGVEFEILNKKLEVIGKIITNEKGEAISSELPSYDKIYYIREVKTQDNYILNNELIEVQLDEDNEYTQIIIKNTPVEPEPEPEPEPQPQPQPQPEPEPEPEPEIQPEPEPEPIKKLPKTGM